MTECYSCAQESHLDAAGQSERVWLGDHWRVAHAIGSALPGCSAISYVPAILS